MEEKEIKINVPNGYEIDKENSTFECIKFKPIKKELPKTWEEYCKTRPKREGESWISDESEIKSIGYDTYKHRNYFDDRNLLPNKEYAKAMLALCQLIQLRDCYNNGWIPDQSNNESKLIIYVNKNQLIKDIRMNISCILAFKTRKLRDKFLENFRDLIETAKPLL